MLEQNEMQIKRIDAEQIAEMQANLSDPKKLVLYGFALGLKAEMPLTTPLPSMKDEKRVG